MAFIPHPARRPVLVAGASSGIGAATAEYLAAAGHPVALAARRVEKLQELADKITAAGGEAVAVPLDVTDEQSVTDCVAKAEAALGPIEIVICGAGDLAIGLSYESTPAEWASQIDIHLVGAHRVYRAVVPGMIDRARGDFVFIGSDVAVHPRPWSSAYVAAKFGIDGLAATAQLELEGTGVRASVVRPGQTITGMGMNLEPEKTEAMLNDWIKHGLARHSNFLSPEHLALAIGAVVWMPRGAHMRSVEVEAEGSVPRHKREAQEAREAQAAQAAREAQKAKNNQESRNTEPEKGADA